MEGQRNCPKHVEFYSKNKFEKLVLLVGFIIRIYHDARSPEREICCGTNSAEFYTSLLKLCTYIHTYIQYSVGATTVNTADF